MTKTLTFCIYLVLGYLLNPILAQNYQTFRSSDVHYFKEVNEGLMLASQIDSVEFIAGDSILYPFTSLRPHETFSLVKAPGWMGDKIIIRADGMNVFFNVKSDSIFIDTQAELGETFTLYTYESGYTIEATVSSITEELVFDVLDNVKTYTLSSDEPSFDFETPEFRIGENTGLLDIYPFYSFPNAYNPINGPNTVAEKYNLVGQLYPRKGITKPTYHDLSDVQVGDVVQNKRYNGPFTWTKRNTILSKNLIGVDSVQYEYERYQNYHFDGVSEENPDFDSLTTTILIDTFLISDEYVSGELIPEKNYGEGMTDYSFTLYNDESCEYREWFHSWGSFRIDTDTIEAYGIFEPVLTSKDNRSRAIWKHSTYYYNTGVDILDEGSYFMSGKYGDEICGNGTFLSIADTEKAEVLSVYPNPSNGSFLIKTEGIVDLQIYSVDGRLKYAENGIQPFDQINTALPNGTYFLIIKQNNQTYNARIIIAN